MVDFPAQGWGPVIAVGQQDSLGICGHFRDHGQVMHVGRGQAEAGDQPGPVQTQVHPETVEGLPGCVIPPESSLSPEPLTAVGLGERQTGRGKLSTMAKSGLYRMEPGRICQICSLTHQRLAAWRTKVVRQTWAISGKKWL